MRKTILFVGAVFVLSLVIFPVAAQIGPVTDDVGIPTPTTPDAAENVLINIINVVLGFVGIIALIFLIYGGVLYITSSGDDTRAEHAKKTLLYAVVGLLVVGLAAAIVNFVIRAVGGAGAPPAP